jgi:hypothetical protein
LTFHSIFFHPKEEDYVVVLGQGGMGAIKPYKLGETPKFQSVIKEKLKE